MKNLERGDITVVQILTLYGGKWGRMEESENMTSGDCGRGGSGFSHTLPKEAARKQAV